MDIVFETNIENILNIFFICLKNKNNYVFSNMVHEIKKDIKNSHYILLNDYQMDFLNIGFLKSAKSHRLIYDNKYKAFIQDMVINNNYFVIISIVTMDNINTYLLFNNKYVSLKFKQFLFETKKLNTDLLKYNKYDIPVKNRTQNMLFHRNNKSYKKRNKESQIKLRNKLNKRYEYLTNRERIFLNKQDRKKPDNNSDISFIESMDNMEVKLKDLIDSLESIEDMDEYDKIINQIYLLEYDLEEKQVILNKDIKENIYYSNINY